LKGRTKKKKTKAIVEQIVFIFGFVVFNGGLVKGA